MNIKNKMSLFFLVILLINSPVLGILLHNFDFCANPPQVIIKCSSTINKTIAVYVNSTIFSNISTELSQYVQDLNNEGYTFRLINYST